MRNPHLGNPNPQDCRSTASSIASSIAPASSRKLGRVRSLIALIGVSIAISASGCMGGAELREPTSGLALEKSRWVFPLFHYQEKEGRKTFTPFFLVPIPVGKTDAALAAEGGDSVEPTTSIAAGRGLRSVESLDTRGTDAPAWGSDERGAPPVIVSTRSEDSIPPGVWDSSLPPAQATLDLADPITRSHQVQPGDTLFALANHYYGNGKQWRRIADANRDRMPSPEKLAVGVRLRIP